MQLDHLVINTRFHTDDAAAQCAALGFTLTPRGRHTLGSINHLVMFDNHYLELIGLPTDGGNLRDEVLSSPFGIDGLVFQTDAPERTASDVAAHGFTLGPVQRFSRPVEIDGLHRDATFVTVRLQPGQVDAGRVYYCQHLTPELVWRSPWLTHENGVQRIIALTVVGHDPAALRRQYTQLGGNIETRVHADSASSRSTTSDAAFLIRVTDPGSFAMRFGDVAQYAPTLAPMPGAARHLPEDPTALRAGFFGAITFHAEAPITLARRAQAAGLPFFIDGLSIEDLHSARADAACRVVVALPAFSTLLEFQK
ncbi:VOC family protein [Robbsia andropogonis]|uniref:VOC family protein n=1 Tax=Robbsia andropogonis TaxID=28092 RepID=UPI003D24BBD9